MCHTRAPIRRVDAPAATRVEIPLPDEPMPAWLAVPEGGQDGRVLLLHDVFGPSAFYQELAIRLGRAGFLTLLPDLFFREGALTETSLPAAYQRLLSADNQFLIRDAHAAADWLMQSEDSVDCIGTIGFCWGGTQVLVMAAERQDIATVCFYGMPADPRYLSDPKSTRPIDMIDSISGSVLGFWGDQDARAGMDNVRGFLEAARSKGVDVEGHIYPGLGHGFMSKLEAVNDPSSEAIEHAWNRTVGFLQEQLKENVNG
jgi:carboxymethylenebutenolidase